MLSAQQAEALILNLAQPLDPQYDVEQVGLLSAVGRILATPVTSQLDFPHWDNSAMDGYAVRFADVQASRADNPVVLEVVDEIAAGSIPQKPIHTGQAARILTGSMMPTGADTVMMQEVVTREGDRLLISTPPKPQEFVRHRGVYYQAGSPLLPAGISLNAPEIAVLAAAQCTQVTVYRRLRVAILSTGDELVSPDQPLQPGQIVDSNQYALASLIAQAGAEPLLLGVVPDDPERLKEAIAQAIQQADVILSSGGVSVGDYDYVERILETLGAEIHIRSVAVKPGKPLTVATFNPFFASADMVNRVSPPPLYFGLPGNPVSALVSVWRFVLPALRKQAGLASGWGSIWIKGQSHHTLKSDGKRETYLWGQLRAVDGEFEFHLASGSHLSGNLINLAQTNALAVIPVGQTLISPGEPVQVMLINPSL
ncbi:MAG: molybdopterin molybdotransferase MoeA [Leptolyngbyaceae cyanobacterium bins.302]|nr:molybdopterin molybdotransferase MoeA [Leptolyngbyaceae cyanobacterium bins.302]